MKNSLAMHIPCKNPHNQTNVQGVHCVQVIRNASILLLLLGPGIFKCISHQLVCILWGAPWCRILHISLGAAQDMAPARLSHPLLAREEDSVATRLCLRTWTSSTVLPKPRIPIKGVLLNQDLFNWCCKCVLPSIRGQTEHTCFTSYKYCLHNSSQSLYFYICNIYDLFYLKRLCQLPNSFYCTCLTVWKTISKQTLLIGRKCLSFPSKLLF